MQDQSFHLHKQEFWYAFHLSYGWKLANKPIVTMLVGHLLVLTICIVWYVKMVASSIFISEINDIITDWLSKVYYDAVIEIPLQ